MEIEDLINAFEEKAFLIKDSVNFKGTHRVIKEKDWQKIKKRFTPRYGVDDINDMLMEVQDD